MRAGQPEAQYGHVFGHEVGHLIDDLTFGRAIPSTGIRNSIDRLYSTENSAVAVPAGRLGATPEAYGYKGTKADAERMAEAVRLYLRGSPARAGIGPVRTDTASPSGRFPRASGDRPLHESAPPASLKVPPRERG